MKKLMIAAAMICSAVALNAATCSWSVSKVYAGNTSDKASGIAYFLNTTDYGAASAFIKSYTGAGATAVSSALEDAYSFSVASGSFDNSASPVANATLGLTDDTSYTGYLVIFDTATITEKSNFYVSSTSDFKALAGTSNQPIAFGSQKSDSQAAANWHAVANVPEPTSGLLLVLGMAGLALRRRRA